MKLPLPCSLSFTITPFLIHEPFRRTGKQSKKAGSSIYKNILNEGASDAVVEEFQKAIKLDVPEEFINFYKVCDGGQYDEVVDVEDMSFLSLEKVSYLKQMFDKILDEKQKRASFFCWHKDWIPFADDHSYDTLFIDTTGKATGKKGGVLSRSKDTFEGDELLLLATSFGSFIEGWVKRVEEEQIYFLSGNEDDDNNDLVEDGSFEFDRSLGFVPFKGSE